MARRLSITPKKGKYYLMDPILVIRPEPFPVETVRIMRVRPSSR